MASESTVSTRMTAGASRWARAGRRTGGVRRRRRAPCLPGWPTSAASGAGRTGCASERHEVAGRQYADHLAFGVEHRQVVDPRGHHGDARLGGQHLGADGVDGRGHDLGDRRFARHAQEHDLVAKVDVGDDPQAVAQPHEQGAAPGVGEHAGGLANGRVGVAEQGERCAPARSPAGCARRAARAWRASPE